MLALWNIAYFVLFVLATLVWGVAEPLIVLSIILVSGRRFDDVMRIHNCLYGRYVIAVSWPLIRMRVEGRENVPKDRPGVFIYNHFSAFDVFFSSIASVPNTEILVRDWVFRLKPFGWAMRLARYINIDMTSAEEMRSLASEFAKRGVSFQVYPEGHRSRDGKLQRFRTGAFVIACDNDLPILPVVLIGTYPFFTKKFPFLHPVRVTVRILPPVYPDRFDGDSRRMRKHVKSLYVEQLEE
jgi:1-acyl-sn-glycerol-3-phosphate acyltransferase